MDGINLEILKQNKIKINRQFVYLPESIINLIDNSDFGNVVKAKVLNLLNQINIGEVRSLSRSFLRKSLGGNYNIIINYLMQNNILSTDGSYSTNYNQCKKYILHYHYTPSNKRVDLFEYLNKVGYLTGQIERVYTDSESTHLKNRYVDDICKANDHIISNLELNDKAAKYIIKSKVDSIVKHNYNIYTAANCHELGAANQIKIWIKGNFEPKFMKVEQLQKHLIKCNRIAIQEIKTGKIYTVKDTASFLKWKKEKTYNALNSQWNNVLNAPATFRSLTNDRLFTPLTNLYSPLLEAIKINDEKLVSIDLSNSQPLLLAQNIVNYHSELLQNPEIKEFVTASQEGKVYEFFQSKLNLSSRNEAKKTVMQLFFSSNKLNTNLKKKVNEILPTFYEFLKSKKGKTHKNLSINLQKMEASIFVDEILKTLLNSGIPAISKHDSILIPQSQIENTLIVMVSILDVFFEKNYKLKLD